MVLFFFILKMFLKENIISGDFSVGILISQKEKDQPFNPNIAKSTHLLSVAAKLFEIFLIFKRNKQSPCCYIK